MISTKSAPPTWQSSMVDRPMRLFKHCWKPILMQSASARPIMSLLKIAARKPASMCCEKPMAGSIQDCEDMLKAAREAGRFLMLGHNQRLAKAHVKARELIESGLIGDIITFRTTFFHGGPETWSIDPGPNTWFFDKNEP